MARGTVLAVLAALLQGAPASDLILYWPLDEAAGPTAADAEGGNPGTYVGTPAPSTDRPTLLFTNDRSLSFDGTSDALSRSAVTGLAAGNTPHTLATWIKVVALPANRAWIALLGNAGAGAHHWLLNSAGTTQFGVWNGTQKQPVLPVGEWHHVAVTFDGTNLAAYVDGVEVGTAAPASFNLQGVPFTVAQAHNNENFFNGILDDVRIYDRALTAAEVQYLSDGNGPPAAPTLSATAEIRAIRLDWTAVTGASSYTLYRSTTPGDPNPAVLAAGLSGLTYTDPDLDPPTRFYYRVRAHHPVGGSSPLSAEASEVPLPNPPRTNDHDEGLLDDDRCSCGTISGTGGLELLGLGLLLAVGASFRRA